MKSAACPCQSGQPYAVCCEIYHQQITLPQSAEHLMRSRYSAYYLQLVDYIAQTQLEFSHQQTTTAEQTELAKTQWLGLQIIASKQTVDKAQVEFVAFYTDATTRLGQLHECSVFHYQQDRWYYVSGKFLKPLKMGRNMPCICGSGRKLKQCHG